MKEGWKSETIENACNINCGTRVVQKKDGGTIYPVYGGGGATFRMDKYNREDCLVISRFAMSKQCTRFVSGKFFLNDSGLTVESKLEILSQDYLNWHILALNDEIYFLGKGVAQKNLDMRSFRVLKIKIPPLSEQQHIVEELDLLSSIIEKKKAQLNELDNLAQSLFYEMFGDPITNDKGWEVKSLKELVYIGLGFTHTPQYIDKGVPFISVKDISSGYIDLSNIKYVSKEEYDSAPKGAKPQKGDLMFCRVGTMGKPLIVETDMQFCTFVSVGYMRKLQNNINMSFLKYWMMSNSFDKQVEANVRGLAIKNLNTGWLKNFSIYLPPLSLQKQFASKIEAIEHQKELIKKSIKEVETLFNSRMDYYFN